MSEDRLGDYLEQMRIATTDALSFVEGMHKDDFLADKRTQQADRHEHHYSRRGRDQDHGEAS